MQTTVNNKMSFENNQTGPICANCRSTIFVNPTIDDKGRSFCNKDCRKIYHKRLLITQKTNQIDVLLTKYMDYLTHKVKDMRISQTTKTEYSNDLKRIKNLLLDFQSISVFEYSAESLLLKDNHIQKLEERLQLHKIEIERLRSQRERLSKDLQNIKLRQKNPKIENQKDIDGHRIIYEELLAGEDYFVNEIKDLLLAETMSVEQIDDIASAVNNLREKRAQGMTHLEIQKQMIESRKANLDLRRDN